jgi:hypothetical protein
LNNKKQYYGLDEIGFVGVQDKPKNSSRLKKDIDLTVQYIKDKKAGHSVSPPAKASSRKA